MQRSEAFIDIHSPVDQHGGPGLLCLGPFPFNLFVSSAGLRQSDANRDIETKCRPVLEDHKRQHTVTDGLNFENFSAFGDQIESLIDRLKEDEDLRRLGMNSRKNPAMSAKNTVCGNKSAIGVSSISPLRHLRQTRMI
jgi:hypothetical protein